MAKVFVVHQPYPGPRGFVYDISPALNYGEIVFVFPQDYHPSLDPNDATNRARKALSDFDTTRDFVLWAGGDPAAMIVVGAVLSELTDVGEAVNYLRWERARDSEGNRGPRGYYMAVPLKL